MELLTVKEAARRKGCTLKYVYDLLAAGRIDGARKDGPKWSIPSTALPMGSIPNQAGQTEEAAPLGK
jgi:excisionase family DNA binding protein